MTSTEALRELTSSLLHVYDEREAGNIADWVVENITGEKKWERRQNDTAWDETKERLFRQYSEDLMKRKPVQYVLNEAWFCGLKFKLNENVLIPRPETEELVALIAKENKDKNNFAVLDIGSGSGCIAIAIKSRLTTAKVTSIDVSEDAIATAKMNANLLRMDVDFLRIDFLNESTWPQFGNFDLLVSNPPYIPAAEKDMLDKNVVDFEPSVALFVPDNDPFIFYRKISDFARHHLHPTGSIYLEVHESYAADVLDIFTGEFGHSEIVSDIFGKERYVRCSR